MKTTKRSLLTSAICLLLTAVMLMGSTFAWFTDSVTNTDNKIQAGTLKVEITGDSLFTDEDGTFLWEPGRSQKAAVTVSNKGSLYLKYTMSFSNVKIDDNVGEDSNITEVLDVYKVDENFSEVSDTDLIEDNKLGTMAELMDQGWFVVKDGVLAPNDNAPGGDDEKTFTLVIKMQTGAGNKYQGASVVFDIEVKATQATEEVDGFGQKDYDKDAFFADATASDEQTLKDAISNATDGDVIALQAPVQQTSTLAISKDITLNLGDNSISNEISGQDSVSISGNGKDVTIKATTGGIHKVDDHCIRVSATDSNIVIDGGVHSVAGTYNAYFMEGTMSGSNNNTITIQNVTYTGDRGVSFSYNYGNEIFVKDSTFNCSGYSAFYIGGNNVCTLENVTVTGGSSVRVMAADSGGSASKGYSTIYILSGTYDCNLTASTGCTISISGGSFSSNPTRFLAEGYTATRGTDGMWTVTPET